MRTNIFVRVVCGISVLIFVVSPLFADVTYSNQNITESVDTTGSNLTVDTLGPHNAVGSTTLGGTATFADAILKIEVDASGMDILSVDSISFTGASVLSIETINGYTLKPNTRSHFYKRRRHCQRSIGESW
ncbi:MAG: hypothetical protein Q4D38_03450 [Planctomycetia bacterium]|nr:hypothetical protein [Planctomycetia bacterium]